MNTSDRLNSIEVVTIAPMAFLSTKSLDQHNG